MGFCLKNSFFRLTGFGFWANLNFYEPQRNADMQNKSLTITCVMASLALSACVGATNDSNYEELYGGNAGNVSINAAGDYIVHNGIVGHVTGNYIVKGGIVGNVIGNVIVYSGIVGNVSGDATVHDGTIGNVGGNAIVHGGIVGDVGGDATVYGGSVDDVDGHLILLGGTVGNHWWWRWW